MLITDFAIKALTENAVQTRHAQIALELANQNTYIFKAIPKINEAIKHALTYTADMMNKSALCTVYLDNKEAPFIIKEYLKSQPNISGVSSLVMINFTAVEFTISA